MVGIVELPGGWWDWAGGRHREAELEPLRGADEQWLAETDPRTPLAVVAGELLERRVRRIGPFPATRARLRELPAGDWDALLAGLWGLSLGSRAELVARCPACRADIDLDFGLDALPVTPGQDAPRHRLGDLAFRLPTGGDLEALAHRPDPRALLERCVLAGSLGDEAELAREIERLAPGVADELEAHCPECGHVFALAFRPLTALPAELVRRRRDFERDVHALSLHYHWPLSEILELPLPRRRHYVERLLAHVEPVPA